MLKMFLGNLIAAVLTMALIWGSIEISLMSSRLDVTASIPIVQR